MIVGLFGDPKKEPTTSSQWLYFDEGYIYEVCLGLEALLAISTDIRTLGELEHPSYSLDCIEIDLVWDLELSSAHT
jgi:hypothetical protein